MQVACDHCGVQFKRKPSQVQKYKHNFCSRKCKKNWQQGQKKPEQVKGDWYPCASCGKLLWRTPAILRGHVFCSTTCQRRYFPHPKLGKSGASGEHHHNWKGGISLLPYAPGFTRMTSRQIRERDGNRCKVCGTPPRRPGDLVAHHIDLSKNNHDPSNLVTLCRTCHQDVHNGKASLP